MSADRQVLPDAVWSAFWVLALAGLLLGILCGAGVLSGLALGLIVVAAVAVFVPWAVTLTSPQTLAEETEYRNGDRGHD